MLPGESISESLNQTWLWKGPDSWARRIALKAGQTVPSHRHRRHRKVILVESGELLVTLAQTSLRRQTGDVIAVAKNTSLRYENLASGAAILIEISFPEANRDWYLLEDEILELSHVEKD